MRRYNVNAEVKICLDIIVQFDDDGKTDLEDQAREAVLEDSDLPLDLRHEAEIESLVFEEIE